MGIVSRFFLLLYVLVVMVTVLVFSGVCIQLIPKQIWQSYLNYIIVQQETVVVLALMLFFSFFFLGFVFSSRKDTQASGEILLKEGEPGEVKVAIEAIKRVIERAALSISGVREAKVNLLKNKGDIPISVRLTIILGQGHSAPIVSEAVVNAIDKAIFTALQIGGVPVDVKVKDITNAVVERKQRVV